MGIDQSTVREDESPSTEGNTSPELIVVGVGASAGGLEALQVMVSNLPADLNMSFIVAQHLSPTHKSMMVDLLVKDSTLPISAAVHDEQLRPNCIYICPPNYNIELAAGDRIKLTTYPHTRVTPRPSVDMLLESIARVKGDHSIGIILSGTGSDGSRGIRAIKADNGFGIVQDPKSAKYDGMPNAAINSGNVDLIVSASEIGNELQSILSFPRTGNDASDNIIPRDTYNTIIRLLKKQTKVDFSLYKDSTILRRIARRMTSLRIKDPQDYVRRLNKQSEEISFLFNDMLIGVTSFFRDARAFETLQKELTHYLLKKEDKTIRIWSAGCSTGEEPYSIAMIVSEILGDKASEYKIQIFATDIDERSIAYARKAVYPEVALHNLPNEIREKYFTGENEVFEVAKSIKSMVIFSIHDLNNDPPFLRLDLISCRNLMIYFTAELQRIALPVFHYALNPKGLLFLGLSESIGLFQEQYRNLSKSAKIYEAKYSGKKLPPERVTTKHRVEDYVEPKDIPTEKYVGSHQKFENEYASVITEKLKEVLLPNSVLINENHDIVFTEGSNPLLVRNEGVPSNNVFKNFHPKLSIELRSALHQIDNGERYKDAGFHKLKLDGSDCWAKLILMRIERPSPLGKLTLIFCSIEKASDTAHHHVDDYGSSSSSKISIEHERLLSRTREQLQNVIEELETSNEEMQSMNEELQSSNEELQSSNEELETTNEELQSTNEELQTAYAELRMAYEEKDQQQQELQLLRRNLEQSNTLLQDAERIGNMGSWLWDIGTRQLDWSNGCYSLFDLDKASFQPSFEAFIGLAHPDDRNALEQHMMDLLSNKAKQPFVFKSFGKEKQDIIVSLDAVVSFNDLKQAIKVMGTMTDITKIASYERSSIAYKDQISYILNSSLNCAYIYSFDTSSMEYVNPTMTQHFGISESDLDNLKGESFYNLFAEDDQKPMQDHFMKVMNGVPGATYPSSYSLKNIISGELIPVYSNHTIYELNEITGKAKRMLVTFFLAEDKQ